MAHFAELESKTDPTGFTSDTHLIVKQVTVVANDVETAAGPLGENNMHVDGETWCKNFFNKPDTEFKQTSYASEARTVISNIYNASKMYYQTKGEWPGDVEQLERAGQLDLNRSTKLKWTFELQLPDRLSATSTEEMQGGAGKVVSFDALTGKFQGYGSPDESQ